MILFLRKIPTHSNESDIRRLLQPAIKHGLFRQKGNIIDIDILRLKDLRTSLVEQHGLVMVDSDSTGQHVLKKLRGALLNGRRIMIREYRLRSYQNDPRLNSMPLSSKLQEKRQGDRRRNSNQIQRLQTHAVDFLDTSAFHRKMSF